MEESKKEELFIPKTKHKFLKIMFGIILIGAAIAGGYFLYKDKFTNPKNIVRKILEESNTNMESTLTGIDTNSMYEVNGIVKINANLGEENKKVTDILNDIDLQFTGQINTKDMNGNIDFSTKYQENKLIDLKTYFENKIYYVLLDGIYDKYLVIDDYSKKNNESIKTEALLQNIELNSKYLKTITNALGKAFKEEIVNYSFNQEKATITVDGKEVNVLNNFVILKNNDLNKLATAIIKNVSQNNEAITALNNLTNDDGKSILNAISTSINEGSFIGTYRLNFYTDRGLFNKKLVSFRQEITQSNITTSLNIDQIEDGVILSTNTLGISYAVKVVRNNSNFNLKISFNAINNYADIDISMNYEKINEIKKTDVSNSIKLEDLKEEDKKKIEDAFANNEVLNSILNKLKDSMPELKA